MNDAQVGREVFETTVEFMKVFGKKADLEQKTT